MGLSNPSKLPISKNISHKNKKIQRMKTTITTLAIVCLITMLSAPVSARLEVVTQDTSPNPHNRLLANTTYCDDLNCIRCSTTSKSTCILCRDTYRKVKNTVNQYVCISCYGCEAGSSCNLVKNTSCNKCNSGFKRVYDSNTSSYFCAQNFRNSSAGLGLVVILSFWLICAATVFGARWCCNEMMHKSYSYEAVVLANQPPPYKNKGQMPC